MTALLTVDEQHTFQEWLSVLGHVEFQDEDPDGDVVRTLIRFIFDRIEEQGLRLARLEDKA